MLFIDLGRNAKGMICLAILFIVILMLIFLGRIKYYEFYDMREKNYNDAKESTLICSNPKYSGNEKLQEFCKEARADAKKSPDVYALKDVICIVLPCTLLDNNSFESIAIYVFDVVSGRLINAIVIVLVGYILAVFFGLISVRSTDVRPIILPVYGTRERDDIPMIQHDEKSNSRRRFVTNQQEMQMITQY